MPWTTSKEGTLPSLKNKSIAARKIFADVANKLMREGKPEKQAIEAGLAAIANHEKNKHVKKQLNPLEENHNSVPLHLKLIQEAKELKVRKQQDNIQDIQISIKEVYFDDYGSLIIVNSDGTRIKSKNQVIGDIINKHVNVAIQEAASFDPLVALNNAGEPELIFSDGEVVF